MASAEGPIDLLIANAVVRTMVAAEPAEAVAIGDGVIRAVGTAADVAGLAGNGTTVVDAGGGTLLPAAIDSHTHLHRASLFRALFLDFDQLECTSIADVVAAVAARAGRTPPEAWIQGDNLRDHRLEERRWPVRQELDAVSPRNPVVIRSLGKHLVIANSRALQMAGIDRDTEDPPGGRIEHDADGEPTGVLHETGKLRLDAARADAVVPPIEERERLGALRDGIGLLQQSGISTIHEIVTRPDEIADYLRLREQGNLGVRVRYYIRAVEAQTNLAQMLGLGLRSGFGDDWVRIGGIKISVDGSCELRNAALFEPYPGQPENRGLIRVPQPELNDLFRNADRGGLQIAVHAIGPRAADMALTAYEHALGDRPGNLLRHRLEHMYVPGPQSHFERAHRLRLILSEQPALIHASGDAWREIFGESGLDRMMPLRLALDLGLTIQANSDFPSSPINPMLGIMAAVTRRTRSGAPVDPSQAISVGEAMAMMTTVPAATTFEEDVAGSIEVGKRADLRLLADDPYRVASDQLADIAVRLTVLDGRPVYSDGSALPPTEQ